MPQKKMTNCGRKIDSKNNWREDEFTYGKIWIFRGRI